MRAKIEIYRLKTKIITANVFKNAPGEASSSGERFTGCFAAHIFLAQVHRTSVR
jgi:hypothetical protein